MCSGCVFVTYTFCPTSICTYSAARIPGQLTRPDQSGGGSLTGQAPLGRVNGSPSFRRRSTDRDEDGGGAPLRSTRRTNKRTPFRIVRYNGVPNQCPQPDGHVTTLRCCRTAEIPQLCSSIALLYKRPCPLKCTCQQLKKHRILTGAIWSKVEREGGRLELAALLPHHDLVNTTHDDPLPSAR